MHMPSTAISSWQTCYYYPLPKHMFPLVTVVSRKIPNSKPPNIQFANCKFPALTAAYSSSKAQEKRRSYYTENTHFPDQENHRNSKKICSSGKTPKPRIEEGEERIESARYTYWNIPLNMWADFKAALGQRINVEGIVCFLGILVKDRHLVMPHVSVPDIRYIDWAKLKNSGFKGVVFDKDNTITVPYSLSLWGPLGSSIEQCKSLFGDNIAVFSNSAGLQEYDPDGGKARALEDAIGIKVIRHRGKKPGGTAEEIEDHFGCESSGLIMVGDRPFTDIVFGNRHGLFTILTAALSHAEEPIIVRQVRLLEMAVIKRWSNKGLKPISHKLLPDSTNCVNDVPCDARS